MTAKFPLAETDPAASAGLSTHAGLTTSAHGGLVAASDAKLLPTTLWNAAKPTGALREAFPRYLSNNAAVPMTSARLRLAPIWLCAGDSISSISFLSGTTALSAGSNQWFALYNSSTLALLKQTTDDTSTAWPINTVKTLNVTGGSYTVPSSGVYLLGCLVVASTPPTLAGIGSTSGAILSLAPAYTGLSTAGLTGTAPNPAAAPSVVNAIAWGYVS